ncbi:hypothetical protein CABS01_13882, partial [Colletotrichum abscissum]|uniref:uncharacterized protein n=1 Tax=Colletotrichum abscissum TaxID=1671311 RepID=UPI0027D6AD57
AFVDLINRPWFSRRWTVQEAVLSNQKYAHLGSRTFCLGYLVWLCGFGSLQLKFYHLHKEPLEYSECRRVCVDHGYTHKNPTPVVDPIDTILRVWRAYSAFTRGDKPSLTLERLLDNFQDSSLLMPETVFMPSCQWQVTLTRRNDFHTTQTKLQLRRSLPKLHCISYNRLEV